jgi:hypothetical protein
MKDLDRVELVREKCRYLHIHHNPEWMQAKPSVLELVRGMVPLEGNVDLVRHLHLLQALP